MTDLFCHLVGSGILTKLVLKTATILQLIDTDISGDTTRKQSVRTQKHQAFDVVRLTPVNWGENPFFIASFRICLQSDTDNPRINTSSIEGIIFFVDCKCQYICLKMIKALYQGSKFKIPNSNFSKWVSCNQILFILFESPNQTLLLLCCFINVKNAISSFNLPFLDGTVRVACKNVGSWSKKFLFIFILWWFRIRIIFFLGLLYFFHFFLFWTLQDIDA